ncbi:hypothetical protein K431DRAFT_281372 [Polychaeton citri CBS 116435]|uniref:Uncharacterized protein n=1 Tax=Polychaeton citri CBS 116435 TaxID=1314669 RepID=A0A9P4QHC4_9PEZI|nr:hypothetical protein K431DRAFT_281372 [Polychaeton citri CBS 116435]
MHHRHVVRFAWTGSSARPRTPLRRIVTHSQLQASHKSRHNETEHTNERRRRIAAVQDEDQYLLKVVKNRLDNIVTLVKDAQVHGEATTPHSSRPTSILDGADRSHGIPEYTTGRNRGGQPTVFSNAAQKTIKAAEKLQLHMEDLQLEPYPNRSRSDLALWAAEMRQWSQERKREELEELRLQEEADRKRLNENTRNLVTFMRELMAAGKSAKAANAEPKEVPVVFQKLPTPKARGGRRRPNFIRHKLSAVYTSAKGSAPGTGKEKAVAPPKQPKGDAVGLLEMQSKLRSAIRGGAQR